MVISILEMVWVCRAVAAATITITASSATTSGSPFAKILARDAPATITGSCATTTGSPFAQFLARDAKAQARPSDNSSGFLNWSPLWQAKARGAEIPWHIPPQPMRDKGTSVAFIEVRGCCYFSLYSQSLTIRPSNLNLTTKPLSFFQKGRSIFPSWSSQGFPFLMMG